MYRSSPSPTPVAAALSLGLLFAAACGEPVRPDASTRVVQPTPHASRQGTLRAPTAGSQVTAAATVTVAVRDFSFSPQSVTIAQGTTVQWNFSGPSIHTATDNSGMGLFNSGNKPAGSQFSFTFVAAGTYPYFCARHPTLMRGSIKDLLKVSPTSGTRTTRFTTTWASAAPPAGFVFDVQIRRPGSTAFVNWRTAQTARSATFVPDAGVGTYSFRARLRKPAVAKASGYSPIKAITVS